MKFIADLHIHSKYSRATAKNLDLENLYIAARLKGISVVGTGDFTHPEWFCELTEKLVPAGDGLYKLAPAVSEKCDEQVPKSCRGPVSFVLTTEISNIYKKNDRTRKNHNLIMLPDLDSAARFNAKLDAIGNIKSDGRPILGLDARNLLEIMLETEERGFFIPAHIWTPWFSLLGSKSGFDSVEECFEDLTGHIHALETGLSSDPPMNWRVSGLDGYTLVSNSDAHSPANLGRESNLFDTELSYDAIVHAMKTGDPERFLGTLEFYPEEGKYHFDGHRKCDVCFDPEQSLSEKGVCPVCGKPLTLGVLYRVNELSDRAEGVKPPGSHPYYNIIPLADILSEMLRVGPKSKKVQRQYRNVLEKLGPELKVLHDLSAEKIEQARVPLLAESIRRMRENRVYIHPGYDGEFGRVKIFEEGEREKLVSQKRLFITPVKKMAERKAKTYRIGEKNESRIAENERKYSSRDTNSVSDASSAETDLNEEQRLAVESDSCAVVVVAGPGAGKTRTLTRRIAWLILEKGIDPAAVLAVTFTNKAAGEMMERLKELLGEEVGLPTVGTFHSFCLGVLREVESERSFHIVDEDDRMHFVRDVVKSARQDGLRISATPARLLDMIVDAKQEIAGPGDDLRSYARDIEVDLFAELYGRYQGFLEKNGCRDFEDLLFEAVVLFETDPSVLKRYRERFRFVLIDEYQDLNHAQYRLVRALCPGFSGVGALERGLFVIGDPDQSIYGFRGSDVRFFGRFLEDYPEAGTIYLKRNYRSTETILSASYQVIRNRKTKIRTAPRIYSGIRGVPFVSVVETPSDKAEAETIARIVEKLVGGAGFFSIDSGGVDGGGAEIDRSFSDLAVLYRTREQGRLLEKVLEERGVPCQLVGKENLFGKEGAAELLSYLKLVEGVGIYPDIERALPAMKSGLQKTDAAAFADWGRKQGLCAGELIVKAKTLSMPGFGENKPGAFREFARDIEKMRAEFADFSEKMTVKMRLNHLAKQTPLKTLVYGKAANAEAVNKILDFSRQFGKNIDNFLSSVALQTDPDAHFSGVEKVSLMTMHAAKGLEFPVVLIAGCEDGFTPYKRDGGDTDFEEERRLFYVAMTRAMESLYLTWSRKRTIFGKTSERNISPFVEEIERNLRKHEKSWKDKEARRTHVQLRMF